MNRRLDRLLKKLGYFFNHTLWTVGLEDKHYAKRHVLKLARILVSSVFKFYKDEGFIRVGALTYYTINALVPLMALMLWVTARFALGHNFKEVVLGLSPSHSEVVEYVFKFAENMMASLSNSVVFFVGLGFLLWSVFSIMNSIENAFNAVWSVRKGRGIGRKVLIHFSTVLLLPFAMLISISIDVAMKDVVVDFLHKLDFFNFLGGSVLDRWQLFSSFISYAILVGLFSMLYFVFPNRKMQRRSAVIGGAIAALFFILFVRFYIQSQIGMSRANAVFGSFAAIPLFFVWVYFSWTIILYGSYVSYHAETYPAFTTFKEEKVSMSKLKSLCLGIYRQIEVEGERRVLRALSVREISKNFVTSSEQIHLALRYLTDAHFIKPYEAGKEMYCLAVLGETYTDKEILHKIEHLYSEDVALTIKHHFNASTTKSP